MQMGTEQMSAQIDAEHIGAEHIGAEQTSLPVYETMRRDSYSATNEALTAAMTTHMSSSLTCMLAPHSPTSMTSAFSGQKLHSKNKSVKRRKSENEEGTMLAHEKSVSAEQFRGKQSASRGGSAMAVAVGGSLETMVVGRNVDENEGGTLQVKRRKGNDDDHVKDLDEIGSVRMRLPEVVSTLAAEGSVLKWCDALGAFVVLDGAAFERRFNELRYIRSKQVTSQYVVQHRPFSRMHTYFVLIRGEKWAGTGSAFKFKTADPTAAVPGAKTISASAISVQLSAPGKDQPFTVSLQHFLDSMGDLWQTRGPLLPPQPQLFHRRTSTHDAFENSKIKEHVDHLLRLQLDSSSTPADDMPDSPRSRNGETQAAPVPPSMLSSSSGLAMLERHMSSNADESNDDVTRILNTMWNCDSTWWEEEQKMLVQDATDMHDKAEVQLNTLVRPAISLGHLYSSMRTHMF
jgi:hypothetical protein